MNAKKLEVMAKLGSSAARSEAAWVRVLDVLTFPRPAGCSDDAWTSRQIEGLANKDAFKPFEQALGATTCRRLLRETCPDLTEPERHVALLAIRMKRLANALAAARRATDAGVWTLATLVLEREDLSHPHVRCPARRRPGRIAASVETAATRLCRGDDSRRRRGRYS